MSQMFRILVWMTVTVAMASMSSCFASTTIDGFEITKIQMSSRTLGWALARTHNGTAVLNTFDGGSSWNDVSPVNIKNQQNVDTTNIGASFFTSSIAWLASTQILGKATGLVIEHTSDGGMHWSSDSVVDPSNPLPLDGHIYLQFVDSLHGIVLITSGPRMGAMTKYFYKTDDGGYKWFSPRNVLTLKPVVPAPRRTGISTLLPLDIFPTGISFNTPVIGWLSAVNLDSGLSLYKTDDGCIKWSQQQVHAPNPYSSAPAISFPPIFFGKMNGILPVEYLTPSGQKPFFYSMDGGTAWHGETGPDAPASLDLHPYDFVSMQSGWLLDSSVTHLYSTNDGCRNWQLLANISPNRLFDGAERRSVNKEQLQFVDKKNGWMLLGNLVGTDVRTELLKTDDGGINWRTIYYNSHPYVFKLLPLKNAYHPMG